MDKIKLNQKETENLTRIKIKDIRKLLKDISFVLNEFYYDEQIAYLPSVYYNKHQTNPIEDLEKFLDTITFALEEYNFSGWEELDMKQNVDNRVLYDALRSQQRALQKAKEKALISSKFKDKYNDWNNEYKAKNDFPPTGFSMFNRGTLDLEDKIKKDSGWVPYYNDEKFEYVYFIDYNGKKYPLDYIERYDKKETPSLQIISEKLSRGF